MPRHCTLYHLLLNTAAASNVIDGCAILRFPLQMDIHSLVSTILFGQERSFVFTMYLPIGTRVTSCIIARNIALETRARTRAPICTCCTIEVYNVGNQFLDFINFEDTGDTHMINAGTYMCTMSCSLKFGRGK